jgi:H+/Cl- antiporter ClcA
MLPVDTKIAILKWLWRLAFLNAVVSFLVIAYFGGMPDTNDGRFYVNNHGSLREITHTLYTSLWWYVQVSFFLGAIGIICCYWWQRLVKQRKDEHLRYPR